MSTVLSNRSLWYLARGTGVVSLLLLTAVVALGIGSQTSVGAPRVPRFATVLLHRNLSLLVLVFLAIHVATSVLDPFAAIAWTDAVMPLRAGYRPVWLGLGAVAFDLLLALALTSMLRARLGLRIWRSIHWLAYACWPIALVHALGSGSDIRSRWFLGAAAGAIVIVLGAVCWRVTHAPALTIRSRLAVAVLVAVTPLVLAGWLETGPLRPGWAHHAGTPAPLLRHPATIRVTSG
jgi:sulfoxide reductase heme-binding subunit YedZ